jgi:cysteine synthase A
MMAETMIRWSQFFTADLPLGCLLVTMSGDRGASFAPRQAAFNPTIFVAGSAGLSATSVPGMMMSAKPPLRTTQGRGRLFDSVLETIGDTPCIRINHLAPDGVQIYAKAEAFNPASSVKDRLAVNIIEAAERAGTLKPGQTVVEATSGNTGIGLAMVCAQKGYPLVVTMADSFSIERRKLMRLLGAKVVLTPRAQKGYGMYQKAVELAAANGWFLAHQFETAANAEIHEATTAREILADFDGHRLDYFVTGYGTGGTLTGVARVLRKERPDTKIVLSEPANAQLVGSGVAQQRNSDGSPAVSHSAFEPHPIQGWTPDFIPLVLQEALDKGYFDQRIPIAGAEGVKWAKALAQKEGILTGISGGSTFAVARQVAEKAAQGSVILCVLPDTGERYLTTPLFEGVVEDMDAEELAISKSTPGYQMP